MPSGHPKLLGVSTGPVSVDMLDSGHCSQIVNIADLVTGGEDFWLEGQMDTDKADVPQ